MKNSGLKVFITGLSIFFLFSCTDRNNPLIEQIKEKVYADADGADLNYKSLEFLILDTLYISELTEIAFADYNDAISNFEMTDDFSNNKLTKEYLTQLRNQELILRDDPNYYNDVLSGKCKTDWCKELRNQIIETDSLIAMEDHFNNKLKLYKNVVWYYIRSARFNNNTEKLDYRYSKMNDNLKYLIQQQFRRDSLKSLDQNKIVYIRTQNKFMVANPVQNSMDTLEQYFYFDSNLNVTAREDVE